MPITQQRMIAVINAGLDFRTGLTTLIEIVEDQLAQTVRGALTPQQALDNIAINCRPILLLNAFTESEVVLSIEARHYRLNAKRNERRMLRNREARGQYDTQARASAPRSLVVKAQPPAHQPPTREYTPGELSPERKAEIERWSQAQHALQEELAPTQPPTHLTPQGALALEREQAQQPDFDGDLDL